ncbi:hypothetical protein PSA7680_01345 [Pseudoruegeria aquimaris]|uniref:Lysozyme inhibitor LprI N-terminal domain-containing protein n=1 Tax=Pseudoruegeria aquimaris TaxID=393663 RepID=A0A1Y5RZC3_9RHOB|nr:lysozyme inhibitor LprI family protein [Pseudoruegeria aquimaris]SLN29144.1 hypothetical protein PSA7680_01345 [Pseudoruegeria aquimaris]
MLFAAAGFLSSGAISPANADEGDVVQIMLCFDGGGDPGTCSEEFASQCLEEAKSTSETAGAQRSCLVRLTSAWDGIHEGLMRRAAATYSGEHQARFKRYVADWARYDASACAFNAMDFAPATRDMEQLYCQLKRVLKRAEFLIASYESAQVRDPRLPLK